MATICDVHYLDCNYFLTYLCLVDLCNVAQTNSYLMEAARIEFSRRYRQKTIRLSLNDIKNEDFDERKRHVIIYGLRYSLMFLRFFGDLTENLELDIAGAKKNPEDYVWLYLNKFCSKSLISLCIYYADFDLYTNFECIFEKLRKIVFHCCDFYNNLHDIHLMFPNVLDVEVENWTRLLFQSVKTKQLLNDDLTEDNVSELFRIVADKNDKKRKFSDSDDNNDGQMRKKIKFYFFFLCYDCLSI